MYNSRFFSFGLDSDKWFRAAGNDSLEMYWRMKKRVMRLRRALEVAARCLARYGQNKNTSKIITATKPDWNATKQRRLANGILLSQTLFFSQKFEYDIHPEHSLQPLLPTRKYRRLY